MKASESKTYGTPKRLSEDPLASLLLKFAFLVVTIGLLDGCAAIPGMDTYGMREESKVKLPVQRDGETVPSNVKVKEITAELIIAKEREFRAADAGQGSHLPATSDETLLKFDDYRLGPGDILSIVVWDHPELTIPAGEFRSAEQAGTVIAEDGTIYYPYAGVVQVAGKTLREVRAVLNKKLSKYIANVQMDVRIAAFRSKRVYVVGEVNAPGIQKVTDIPLTIVDAINLSGGFTNESDHSQITVTRGDDIYLVDLQALYEDGNTRQNILLQPGDVVNVPDRQFNKIFILGEVNNPGSYIMDNRQKTLAEALADAGDINNFTSNPHQIFVLRGDGENPEIYHLDSKTPDVLLLADRFPLRRRDVVFVDAAEVVRWNRLISHILPTSSVLLNWGQASYPLFGQ